MYAAAQDGAEYDPQVDRGPPAGAGQGAVDGPQTGDVQQLDQKDAPGLHGDVVHTIRVGNGGRRAVIHPKDLLDDLAVCEETHQQKDQTRKK